MEIIDSTQPYFCFTLIALFNIITSFPSNRFELLPCYIFTYLDFMHGSHYLTFPIRSPGLHQAYLALYMVMLMTGLNKLPFWYFGVVECTGWPRTWAHKIHRHGTTNGGKILTFLTLLSSCASLYCDLFHFLDQETYE